MLPETSGLLPSLLGSSISRLIETFECLTTRFLGFGLRMEFLPDGEREMKVVLWLKR